MPANALPITPTEVHAYVDGQLAAERAAVVTEALATDPALAATVAEYKRQNALLHDAFDAELHEPMPSHLLAAAAPRGMFRARALVPYAAAAAMLLVGLATGWFAREQSLERAGTPTTFAREAALTHALYARDANRPVEVWASEEKRLVTWLSRRLNFPLHAPDLNPVGYSLVGGRLVAGNEKPTALFMYENAEKQRLTLQVRKTPGANETAFRYAIEDGVGVYYWIDDQCSYALSGNLDRAQLLAIGRLVYGQLATADAANPSATPEAK
jgi:anti-sigma factor RsiW